MALDVQNESNIKNKNKYLNAIVQKRIKVQNSQIPDQKSKHAKKYVKSKVHNVFQMCSAQN